INRICASAIPGQMAWHHVRLCCHWLAGRRAGRNTHYPELRVARHVYSRRARCARSLVFAESTAGIASLAGIHWTHGRRGCLAAGDRARSRASACAATGAEAFAACETFEEPCFTPQPRDSSANDCGSGRADRHQFLALRFRNLAADILCTAGTEYREIISLFARHGTRRTDRIGDRRFYLRLLGAQADDRRGLHAYHPDRELLSIY